MVRSQIKLRIRRTIGWMYHASNHFLKRLQGKVLILTYHRILPESELGKNLIQPGMYVCDGAFKKQIQFLKEHFHILSFAELLHLWGNKTYDQSKRYCVITFDDGWLDNYTYAYPILKKFHIPATIFLPTSFIGTNQWFWPDQLSYLLKYYCSTSVPQEVEEFITYLWGQYPGMKRVVPLSVPSMNGEKLKDRIDAAIELCKRWPEEEIHELIKKMSRLLGLKFPDERVVLNWEEIDEMSRHAISFGSHSCTHKILIKLPEKEMKKEIEGSLHTLRARKINDIPVFCYPNGNYSQEVVRLVKTAGYQAAVSTHFGFEGRFPEDLFSLRRIGVHHDICATIPLFTLHISGLNNLSTFIL